MDRKEGRTLQTDRNLYQVLGVSDQATEEALKSAYRKLAKQYHPDAHPGDETCEKKFREINDAYTVLSDPEKRKAYDAEQKGQKTGNASSQKADKKETAYTAGSVQVDFEQIHKSFEQFFGYNPKSKEINEEKLKPKQQQNPLDMSQMFESFMGMKR